MKVTFEKSKLMGALGPAAGISQTKNTLVSVDGLLFECPPNKRYGDYDLDNPNLCRISAFDLEKGLRSTIECNVYEEGLFVINTQKILQIVRALPDGDITLEIDNTGKVQISGGYSKFEIAATPGDDFPTMPMFIGENVYKIPQYKVRSLISETIFAVAQNDQRAAFNGALFKIKDGELTVVGCDGNRLAAAKCSIADTNDSPADAEMVIPGKFLGELMKLLRDTEDELTMMIGRKHIIFNIDGIYFFTRMLETEYINYEKLLPTTYMTQAYLSRAELLGAVERASIVTEDKLGGSGRSYVKLDFSGNAITMSSVSSGGSVFEKVMIAKDGADVTIGFNCRYLLESLKACPSDCDRIRIRLNSPLMGVVIEPAEGPTFINARPDASIFGDRALDVAENSTSCDLDSKTNMFMYFVMPIRMNK
ncbi:MAG: DNA polymerase III subunit beta [Ruminococcaceae bacterium]|nr:DNA polymerase III subunit beta [Oscillospiraceae bacterium]